MRDDLVRRRSVPSLSLVAAAFAGQVLAVGLFLLFVLEEAVLVNRFVSTPTWGKIIDRLGGTVRVTPEGVDAVVPLAGPFLLALFISLAAIAGRAVAVHRRGGEQWGDALLGSSTRTAFWSIPIGGWAGLWIVASLTGGSSLIAMLILTVNIVMPFTLAGWLWECVRGQGSGDRGQGTGDEGVSSSPRPFIPSSFMHGPRMVVAVAMLLFSVAFVAMNWGLWFNLRIPHGDSAMYEEHLWNLTHGKGFRSYLDQGLFLGEHIQFIHVLLLPLYLLWPSHLLLELCETLALASGAIFAFRITRRQTGSEWAAAWMSVAYLLYFPMHFLDIAIDLKTFRPEAFGVPLLLWGIDAMERRRWGEMSLAFLLTLTVKEDYPIVMAPLGLWLAATGWCEIRAGAPPATGLTPELSARPSRALRLEGASPVVVGLATCVLTTLYLIIAVKLAIPWFRDWETVHYARYFSKFGETPTEIVWTMLTQPWFTLRQFVTAGTATYLLQVLVPLGFFGMGLVTREQAATAVRPDESFFRRALFSRWGRLSVGGPLFLLLCLNELAQETPGPVHHFHAPLVPIVVWAACAGLEGKGERKKGERGGDSASPDPSSLAPQPSTLNSSLWSLCCALTTAIVFSLSPLGIAFWDSGGSRYWRTLYLPDERARHFENVAPLIPITARVASTDFVHPRFTHHERSYDYSDYPRKVADYLPKVPDDTDYIVIDTRHPYSQVRGPEQVRELRQSPDEWELLPVETQGYFIVLKRVGSRP